MSFASDLKNAIYLAFRDYATDQVPASGEHDPIKAEIRAALLALADVALNAGTTKVVDTVAQLNALPGPFTAGDRAEVRADPLGDVEDGNGVWGYDGAAWQWVSDLYPQSALDAIAAVEAAGIAALAALPASKLVPTTTTISNPNLFALAPIAPHVGDASSVWLGLAAGSNTSTLVEVTLPAGIGKKTLVTPHGGGIPLRYLQNNLPILVQYVAALDKAILLAPNGEYPALLMTDVAAGDAANHIKRKLVAGRYHPHPDAQKFQTIDVIATFEKPFGNVPFTLYDLDGTTQIITGVIRDTDAVTVISEQGAWKPRNRLAIRFEGGAPYLVQPADRTLGRVAQMVADLLDPPQLANKENPVQLRRIDEITWFLDVYPHDSHYTGAQKRNRGSDYVRFVLINMGPFMSVTVAPALNSYFGHFKRQTAPFSNLMYNQVQGAGTDTGMPPSTVEPIFYSKKVGGPAAVQGGLGHGNLYPDASAWKLTGVRADSSTGNLPPFNSGVTAATRTNPLTVTIPGANYQVGRTFTLQGVTGMTQINGVPLTVSSVGVGDVYTINGIDATAWGVFTGHTAGNYVEKDTLNLQDMPIGVVYSGDRVESVFTGLVGTATPGERAFRYTYRHTFASHPDYQCLIQVRYDPTGAGVNVDPATVDGNMAFLLPVRDADECAAFLGGAPVVATHSGTHVMPIGQGDNAQRSIGKVDEVRLWWSGAKTSQIRVKNRAGAPDGGSATGYSHKEGGVPVARSANTFVSTFDWGNKVYGDPIRVVAGEQPVAGIIFDFEFGVTMMSADAIV